MPNIPSLLHLVTALLWLVQTPGGLTLFTKVLIYVNPWFNLWVCCSVAGPDPRGPDFIHQSSHLNPWFNLWVWTQRFKPFHLWTLAFPWPLGCKALTSDSITWEIPPYLFKQLYFNDLFLLCCDMSSTREIIFALFIDLNFVVGCQQAFIDECWMKGWKVRHQSVKSLCREFFFFMIYLNIVCSMWYTGPPWWFRW